MLELSEYLVPFAILIFVHGKSLKRTVYEHISRCLKDTCLECTSNRETTLVSLEIDSPRRIEQLTLDSSLTPKGHQCSYISPIGLTSFLFRQSATDSAILTTRSCV